MAEGLARFFSGDLELNGIIIGAMMIVLGVIILVTIHYLSKEKGGKK
ncbi:MAG: hypothetical protein GY950_17350 [bacterium]|nr:hypothetical protein [bacterium]